MPKKPATDEALYINCRLCHERGEDYPLTMKIEDEQIVVECPEHGLVFSTPYVGPKLRCAKCEEGTPHNHH